MTTKELSLYLNNADEAEAYLFKIGVLKTFNICVQCETSHFGRVRRGKYKCYECKTEWNIRKGSFLESKKIALGDFLGIVKFFSDGVNATRCAEELGIGIKLTRLIYSEFRLKLIDKKITNIHGTSKVSFFIREVDGNINISIGNNTVEEISAAELTATRTKDESGVYYFNFSYKTKYKKNFLRQIERIDNLDNFYRYCQLQLLSFRGRDINALAYTLHELVYRYNHRKNNLLEILISKIK